MFRIWLSFLLEHPDKATESLVSSLDWPDYVYHEQRAWIERFDALTVYQLSSKAWHLSLSEYGQHTQSEIDEWEGGFGKSLLFGISDGDLADDLLDLVLPRVAELEMSDNELLVKPPQEGWKETLGNWRQFVTSPVPWGVFVEFVGGNQELLSYDFKGRYGSARLNSRFRDRFSGFNEEELHDLNRGLGQLG